MFGTVIIDAYRKEETRELAEAIEDLCSPNDNYGWASAGIYCFWDYYAVIWQKDLGNIMEFCQLKKDQSKRRLKSIFQKTRDWDIQFL